MSLTATRFPAHDRISRPHIPFLKTTPQTGVLVVDDDEMIRTVLGLFFRQQGIPFWLAKSGTEAAKLYHEHADRISLVLLDVRMPGWDGPLTLANLRAIDPDFACYFMSGDWAPYTEDELKAMGAEGLIVKPFLFKVLAEVVNHCLASA